MHLLLHIGPHKTGSSSIQKALRLHSASMEAQGVLHFSGQQYPARALSTLFARPNEAAHPSLRRQFADAGTARAWSLREWQTLEERVRKSDARLCILSSEHFATLPDLGPFFKRLHGMFSGISVIAYARDPARLYGSQIQQSVRGGRRLRDLGAPTEYRYPLARTLRKYVAQLDAENIRVRRFERDHLFGGDVVTDFFSEIGRFAKVTPPSPVSVNESLPGAVIAWLLTVNETWDRSILPEARMETLNRLQASKRIAALPSFRLQNREIEALVRTATLQDITWINEHFLPGDGAFAMTDGASVGHGEIAETEQRVLLRDEIMRYLTPEALGILSEAIVPLGHDS